MTFLHLGYQLFSGVEDTVGLGVAHVATLGLAIMLKSTALTKIVPTLCDDGILEGLPADEALEGHILLVAAHLVVLIVIRSISALLQFPLNLPAMFVV